MKTYIVKLVEKEGGKFELEWAERLLGINQHRRTRKTANKRSLGRAINKKGLVVK